jgi:hypothetical protein
LAKRETSAKWAASFRVLPPPDMQVLLERDYYAMTMLITGQVPTFADVMTVIANLGRGSKPAGDS